MDIVNINVNSVGDLNRAIENTFRRQLVHSAAVNSVGGLPRNPADVVYRIFREKVQSVTDRRTAACLGGILHIKIVFQNRVKIEILLNAENIAVRGVDLLCNQLSCRDGIPLCRGQERRHGQPVNVEGDNVQLAGNRVVLFRKSRCGTACENHSRHKNAE